MALISFLNSKKLGYSLKLKRFFIVLNSIAVFIYLFACLVPYIDAGKYWFISITGLIFPILFFILLLFLLVWLLAKSSWCLLSIIALLLSYQQLTAVFSWHFAQQYIHTKQKNNLRIFQWNVSSWDEINKVAKGGISFRPLMFEEVKNSGADVLCFEEFFNSVDTPFYRPTIPEIKNLGYPYHYYIPTHTALENSEMGMAIFSKQPIVNTGIYNFEDSFSAQQIVYSDINFNGDTIRVFAIHLQSVHFGKNEYVSIKELKNRQKEGLKDSRTIIGKLKRGYQGRKFQADIVDSMVRKSPYPVLLCGDFNDVPNSYTYFTVKGNMQDAFLQKGSGIGRTFRFISPTLRIDYIFADKLFKINQYYKLNVPYSDHFGIMADVELNK